MNACLGFVAFWMAGTPWLFALDPEKRITQFTHRSWTAVQGVGEVYSIAQTTDGYLWLATSNGTLRFDGLSFSRLDINPPEPARVGSLPYQVLGSRDGSLWISRGETILRIRGEKQTMYTAADGLPGGVIQSLREEKDGSIWVAGVSEFSRFSAERWQKFGVHNGVPPMFPRTTLLDRHQNLWTVVFDRNRALHIAAVLRPGETTFQAMGDAGFETTRLAEAPDGKIWAAQWPRYAVRAFVPDETGLNFGGVSIAATSRDILFDRDGALWIATLGKGVHRVRNTATLGPVEAGKLIEAEDTFTQQDGLSSDYVLCAFEGREGEIWVGTSGGLDFFGESKFTSISSREGFPFGPSLSLQPAENNGIWAASNLGFTRIEPAGPRIEDHGWFGLKAGGVPFAAFAILSLYSDPEGGLLAGTHQGVLAVQKDGSAASILSGTGDPFPGRRDVSPEKGNLTGVWAMTRDHQGALWIFDELLGAHRLRSGRLEKISIAPIDSNHIVTTCHTDRRGRIWMGIIGRHSGGGSLVCYEEGAVRLYSEKDGLFSGRIHDILSDAKGQLWVAGQGGLGRFDQGRFQTVTRHHGLPDDNILSVLQDDDGFFWLAARSGLFRVNSTELEKVLALQSGTISGDFFDVQDGLRGYVRGYVRSLTGLSGRAIAAKSADGRLWFPTSAGVTTVDPRRILRNTEPPSVHIQKIVADEKSYSPATSPALPVGTRDCEFAYVGICFANPAKVRYRYKLEGYDQQWVEAGSRRQAFYSNLKPGHYTFQVLACNNDGVWNQRGASVEFTIAPAFYERRWFPVVWLVPVALALWGLHRLRLAQQAARANLRLESQFAERQRIARELHDTVLQGFVGVGLKLEAIATKLPEPLAPVRDQLRKILDQADQYLVEARHSVMELRSASLERSDDLSHALAAASKRLTEGIHLDYAVEGPRRELPPLLESNLLRIGEEAVGNAVRHAHPTKVDVKLKFARNEIHLRIRDDGDGFDSKGHEATKPGHFGLIGMHERVKALGGRLTIASQPGKGTEIIVTVPLERAKPRRWLRADETKL